MKNNKIAKDENKLLVWGLVFAIGLYLYLMPKNGGSNFAQNILFVYGLSAVLILLAKLIRRIR